jgi:hypothetical protein
MTGIKIPTNYKGFSQLEVLEVLRPLLKHFYDMGNKDYLTKRSDCELLGGFDLFELCMKGVIRQLEDDK